MTEIPADKLSELLKALATICDSYAYGADNFDQEHWNETVDKIRALWAAGVAEGHRQATDELDNLWGEPFMGSDAVIRQRHRITGDLRMTNDQEMKGVQ